MQPAPRATGAAAPTHVPDAVAPPPHHPRFPLFDGLRAIAVICVVLTHTPGSEALPEYLQRLQVNLSVGVTFFFLISGFLLYRPFIAARGGGAARPPIDSYAKRRFLRIYPAYWVALTVLTLLPGFLGVYPGGAPAQYTLVQTLPVLGGPFTGPFGALGQTWSLVVELSFYIALPLYALGVAKLTRRFEGRGWMRVELLILAGLAVVSLLVRFGLPGEPSEWISFTILGSFVAFSFGMGLAVASVALANRAEQPALVRLTTSYPAAPWALAIALYVALCLLIVPESFIEQTRAQQLTAAAGFAVVGFLLLLPAVFGDGAGGLPRRLLAHPVVAWIGLVSYGIFLWHFAVALKFVGEPYLVSLLGTLSISIALGALSYYLIERPILRLKYRRVSDLIGRRRRPGEATATR